MTLDGIDLLEQCIEAADKGAWEQRWAWAKAVRENDYLTGPTGRLRHRKREELIERAKKTGLILTIAEINYRLLLYRTAPTKAKMITIRDHFGSYDKGKQAGFCPPPATDDHGCAIPDEATLFEQQFLQLLREIEASKQFACDLYELCETRPTYLWTAFVAEFDQREAKAKDEWKVIRRQRIAIEEIEAKVPDRNGKTVFEVLQQFNAKTPKV